MTYLERYAFLHGENAFWQRCEIAALDCADAIFAESAETPNHAARLVWAAAARLDPAAKVREMRNRIAQHSLILAQGSAIPDTTNDWSGLVDVVSSFVDTFATG